jgi:addiction module RelB/DinJ family antitoxin
MATLVQVASRVPPDIKQMANEVVRGYGLDLSSAIRMFVTQIAREKRIPVNISEPQETIYHNDAEVTDFINKELASPERYSPESCGWDI